MASTATTSGGWAASSPYIGANATTQANQSAVNNDGNVVTSPGNDIGAQLGQALSAYHTHQATATPAIAAAATPVASSANSQGYGAAAANQNNADLGAALQASVPYTTPAATTATGYATPSQSKLGIAVGTGLSPVITSAPSAANGGVNTVVAATAPATYIQYMTQQGTTAFAKYDASTGQYVAVDPSAINYAKSQFTSVNGSPTSVTFNDGTSSGYTDYSGQGKTFSLNNLNTQLSAAAQATAAQKAGLAAGSTAATTAAQNTDTTATTAASVNNNQDFINQLSGQLGDINTAPGVQAADQTSANTQNAISSQLSTSGYQSGDLGAASRYGAGSAVGAEGAGALSHEQAAANAYDATFAQLGQAASQQLSVADAETQQQASADVQSIADEISSLQSQLGQLDATTANQVNQHLAALQDQISAYQNGVASYTGTAQASAADFKAILSAAAQVGTIVAAA